MACILLWSSAVRVHESQAYSKTDVTRERIIPILEQKKMLVSTLSMLLSSVLSWRISQVWSPRQIQLSPGTRTCDCPELLSLYFDLLVDAAGVVCHQLGLLGTDLHAVGCGSFVETHN